MNTDPASTPNDSDIAVKSYHATVVGSAAAVAAVILGVVALVLSQPTLVPALRDAKDNISVPSIAIHRVPSVSPRPPAKRAHPVSFSSRHIALAEPIVHPKSTRVPTPATRSESAPARLRSPGTVVVPNTIERDAWDSVKESKDTEQLQHYLDRYPNGAFAGMARAQIAVLQKSAQIALLPPSGAPSTPAAYLPAQSACLEPIAPAAFDGATATTAQMNSAHDDVLTFIKQSDDYQSCLLREFTDASADAVKNKKTLDPSIQPAMQAKLDANQHLKEMVGGEYNASVMAYRAKHPS